MHHNFHVHVHRAAVEGVVVRGLVAPAVPGAWGEIVLMTYASLVSAADIIIVVEQHHFLVLVLTYIIPAISHSIVVEVIVAL